MSYKFIVWLVLTMFCAGCGVQISQNGANTPTLQVITATSLPPSPPPSQTPLPTLDAQSTQLPTLVPVEGITATQLNVRSDPSTASEVLGILPENTQVQIVGKDPGENWWQILYPEAGSANDGKGWVTAEYVTTAGSSQIPVIGGSLSPENPNAALAVVQQQLNVRSGPGTSFNSLGTLNPQDVVSLTGKDSHGAWLQIEYSAGPDGKGWINAAFARAQGVESLPIVSEAGQVIGTGTPVDTPRPPTATIVPAPDDNDSAQAPSTNLVLAADGTRAFQFTSDVSSPSGDGDDWIQFTPFTAMVMLEIECAGNGAVAIAVLENGQLVPGWGSLSCGERKALATNPALIYQFHIQASESGELSYTRFTLTVSSMP